MKKIDTLIHPFSWDATRAELEGLGIRVTLREVRTFGYTPPKREVYRGSAYVQDLCPELELSAIVEDDRVELTLEALTRVGQQGEISITPVEGLLRLDAPRATAVNRIEQPPGGLRLLAAAAAR